MGTKVETLDYEEVYCQWFGCLNCHNSDIMRHFKYCGSCGCEIDWEEPEPKEPVK